MRIKYSLVGSYLVLGRFVASNFSEVVQVALKAEGVNIEK
jgi:hypothetical protein